jgi:hypothetical protein
LLGLKLLSPEYTACTGSVTDVNVTVAIPPVRLAVASTACVTVSTNCTLPVGVPSPGGSAVTTAVHSELKLIRKTLLAARVTVRVTAADVAAGQLESPAHEAVMECAPTANVTTRYAELNARFAEPMFVEPSKKFTAPVGGGVIFPTTRANSTTCCPNTAVAVLTVSSKVSVGVVDEFTVCVYAAEVEP